MVQEGVMNMKSEFENKFEDSLEDEEEEFEEESELDEEELEEGLDGEEEFEGDDFIKRAEKEQLKMQAQIDAYKAGLEKRVEEGPQFDTTWSRKDLGEIWGGAIGGYFLGGFLPGVEGWQGAIAGSAYVILKKAYKGWNKK